MVLRTHIPLHTTGLTFLSTEIMAKGRPTLEIHSKTGTNGARVQFNRQGQHPILWGRLHANMGVLTQIGSPGHSALFLLIGCDEENGKLRKAGAGVHFGVFR